MDIQTKFNLGDKIVFLYENTVCQAKIVEVQISARKHIICGNMISISYQVENPFCTVEEFKAFKTKEELIASL